MCGQNIRGALSYHEGKIRKGEADLLMAWRYGCDAEELSFSEKLNRFTILNDKCITSSYNTVHISLNFSAHDVLDNEKMRLIARDYMKLLGFEKQPYLVYRHHDTAHPHLHIVTTPVRINGRPIYLHNLVQRKSEPARKELERRYELIVAEGRRMATGLSPVMPEKAAYGKEATKAAVSQAVRFVVSQYRYTDWREFDLALRQLGVIADRGEVGSAIRRHRGIVYYIADARGNKTGMGIKGSSIYTAPTCSRIEKRFARNKISKNQSLRFTGLRVRSCIAGSRDMITLLRKLKDQKIQLVTFLKGRPVFIDHQSKIICTEEELGVQLTIQEQLTQSYGMHYADGHGLLAKLMEENWTGSELSGQFKRRKRRKKK